MKNDVTQTTPSKGKPTPKKNEKPGEGLSSSNRLSTIRKSLRSSKRKRKRGGHTTVPTSRSGKKRKSRKPLRMAHMSHRTHSYP